MFNFFIVNSLYYFSFTYLCNSLLIPKIKNSKQMYLIGQIISILLVFLTNQSVSLFNSLLLSISYFIFSYIFFKESPIKKILLPLLLLIIEFTAELISNLFLSVLLDSTYLLDNNSLGFTIISCLSGITTVFLSFFITNIIKSLNWTKYPKYIYFIFLLPITTSLILFNVNNYMKLMKNSKFLIFTLILLVISNFVTILVFFKAIHATEQLYETQKQKIFTELQFNYMQKLYTNNFNIMHTIIRELSKIQNSMNSKNYEMFSNHLYNLNKHILHNFNIINSRSTIVGPIINSYIDTINKNNIQFKTEFEIIDFSFMDVLDQHIIFNELLTIGINYSSLCKNDERLLIIKSKRVNNETFIQALFSNDSENTNMTTNKQYIMIRQITDKYNGDILYDPNYDNNITSILLVFHMKESVK